MCGVFPARELIRETFLSQRKLRPSEISIVLNHNYIFITKFHAILPLVKGRKGWETSHGESSLTFSSLLETPVWYEKYEMVQDCRLMFSGRN